MLPSCIDRVDAVMKISPQQLSAEALTGVVDAFILREGTDYGVQEYTLEEKRQRVLRCSNVAMRKSIFIRKMSILISLWLDSLHTESAGNTT